jgi:hypothetical protein
MRRSRKILTGAASVVGLLMLAGVAQALGEGISQDAADSVKNDPSISVPLEPELPAAPPSATVVNHTQSVPTMPVSCTDYLDLVDNTVQSVYDYENGVAPAEGALSDGLGALVDDDPEALNRARTELNKVQNATTGPLQDIVAAHSALVAAHAACQKDLGR